MSWSVLNSSLPSAYEYNGRVYEMQTDFREWIKFELLLTDGDVCMDDKIRRLQEIIFPVVPYDVRLWDFIMWFYNCGKIQTGSEDRKKTSSKQAAIYSFEHDYGYIYAAFMELYGIDIENIHYLHWWKFKAMFMSLHNCTFTDIVGYRSEKITSKLLITEKISLKKRRNVMHCPGRFLNSKSWMS